MQDTRLLAYYSVGGQAHTHTHHKHTLYSTDMHILSKCVQYILVFVYKKKPLFPSISIRINFMNKTENSDLFGLCRRSESYSNFFLSKKKKN